MTIISPSRGAMRSRLSGYCRAISRKDSCPRTPRDRFVLTHRWRRQSRANSSLKNSLLSVKIQGISSNLGPDHDQVASKTTPISAPYGQISLRRDNREIFAANREFYRMIRQFWPRSGNLKIRAT
jgi:hypothetical protein